MYYFHLSINRLGGYSLIFKEYCLGTDSYVLSSITSIYCFYIIVESFFAMSLTIGGETALPANL